MKRVWKLEVDEEELDALIACVAKLARREFAPWRRYEGLLSRLEKLRRQPSGVKGV